MDLKNNQQARHRNRSARRYKHALERGDFAVVATILGFAEHDPILETMLLKVDLSSQSQDGIIIHPAQLRQARRFLRVLHETTQQTINDEAPDSNQHYPTAVAEKNGIIQERSFQSMQTKTSPLTPNSGPRRDATPRFIRFIQTAAAVLIVGALIAGSVLVFSGRLGKPQQANAGGSQPASPPGIYISRSNIIYRLDAQTRKIIWQKPMPSQSTSSTDLSIAVISDAVYVTENNNLFLGQSSNEFALDAQTGTLRWSRTFTQSVTSPFMDQGLLYFNTRTILYAVNPANGSIVATYTPKYGKSWYAPIVADGVLYYTDDFSGDTLYVEQLSDEKLLWQQQLSNDPLNIPTNGGIVIQNGIVYIPVTPMTTSQNGWVDAFGAHSGKKLWQSPAIMVADGLSTLLITNTMIYVSTLLGHSGKLLAFDVHTHALIWQHPYETYDMQVASGILYIYFGVDTHTQYPSESNFFEALNASTGELLWETPPNPVGGNMLINIVHGIFYGVAWDTSIQGKDITGTIYALNARSGTQIWTMPTNANVIQWGGMIVV